jgi:hypothetical protein
MAETLHLALLVEYMNATKSISAGMAALALAL